METTCQVSYPLNSEKASPPGTVGAYLSCCAEAKPPKRASATVAAAPAAADVARTLRRFGSECVSGMSIIILLGRATLMYSSPGEDGLGAPPRPLPVQVRALIRSYGSPAGGRGSNRQREAQYR